MDARIIERHDVAATLEVTVPADVVDAAFERVLGELGRKVRVPGFRPGRAPRGMLVQLIGAGKLAEEVRDALVDEHYPQAAERLGLTPLHAHTNAEPPERGAVFTFTVQADLYPEFALPDLDAIAIDRAVPPVGDEDVAAAIARLREEHATLVPVERAVVPGDVVFVESQGEGGEQVMPIDLDRTDERLVKQLLGCSVGEELVLDLGPDPAATAADTAPADGDPPEVAGAETPAEAPRRSLAVRLTDVKAKERPDADDAFAATLGFATWTEVEAEIRRRLAIERERETLRAQHDEFVEKLMAATGVGLPGSLVRRRQAALLEDLAGDLQRRGLTMEAYVRRLEERGERERFEQELRGAAERGVKRDLVLQRLVKERGVTVGDAELDLAVRQAAQRERKDPERFRRERGQEWVENLRALLARDMAVDRVVREKTGRPIGEGTRAATEGTLGVATPGGPEGSASGGPETQAGPLESGASATETEVGGGSEG